MLHLYKGRKIQSTLLPWSIKLKNKHINIAQYLPTREKNAAVYLRFPSAAIVSHQYHSKVKIPSWLFPLFPIFLSFFLIFSNFFTVRGGTLPPWPPGLCHCLSQSFGSTDIKPPHLRQDLDFLVKMQSLKREPSMFIFIVVQIRQFACFYLV